MFRNYISKFLICLGVFSSIFTGVSYAEASVSLNQEYPGYDWYIPTYEVNLKLTKEAVLEVEERIVADFSNTSRRGIIRGLTYEYEDAFGGETRVTPIVFKRVEDFSGNSWDYSVYNEFGEKYLRIGDSDIFYSEPLNYEIEYEVENVVNSFGGNGEPLGALKAGNGSVRDELFWNAIGTDWDESPIGYYEVNLDLSEFDQDQVFIVDCFVGEYGSTDKCDVVKNGQIYTASGAMLGHQKGVTWDVEIEGGLMTPRWSWRLFIDKLMELLYVVPFLILFGCFLFWRKHGKDLPKRVVIPTYKLDPDLRAMEVGALVDERFNNEDITAGLIDLAVRGYIDIKEVSKNGFFSKKTFDFIKKKEADDSLSSFEKKLLKGLLGKAQKVNSKDLEGVFYITVKSVKDDVFKFLVKQDYYVKNPNLVFGKYIALGTFSLFGGVWLSSIIQMWFLLIVLVPFGIGMLMIAPFMSKKTKYGMEKHAHILGFKEFIEVAEKDRLKFFQEYQDELSKDDQIKTFEKLLPFAVALGMGDRWSDLFGDMLLNYGYNPVWYSGTDSFSMNNLSNGLNDMGSSMRSASTPPSSSGSGSSGGSFGGGGFSGGGFGGGGGSSW